MTTGYFKHTKIQFRFVLLLIALQVTQLWRGKQNLDGCSISSN